MSDVELSEYEKLISLQQGECAINNAPQVKLDNGLYCIPQHYLQYQHNRSSVEQLVLEIEYSSRYPIFVDEDAGGVYLQVGVIGYDNYPVAERYSRKKLIYGRKWRVEPQLPTSEVIQTVFLAIKKVREHEIRELFRFHHDNSVTTPFNNHHDLPLLAQHSSELFNAENSAAGIADIKEALARLRYDGAKLQLLSAEPRADSSWLLDVGMQPADSTELPELFQRTILLHLPELSVNTLYYQLMDAFINLSDRHVEEVFTYKGYARFSRRNNVAKIAQLSALVRRSANDADFASVFHQANYETDMTRVPSLHKGRLSERIRTELMIHQPLDGILPWDAI